MDEHESTKASAIPSEADTRLRSEATHSEKRGVYHGIVQSTAILGAIRGLTVFLNVARYKALALAVGPAGVGIFGLFDVMVATTVTTSSLGVNVSGVREVAAAGAKGNTAQLAAAIDTLRVLTKILAAIGALVVAVFCVPLSRMTFGKPGFEIPVLIVSLSVFFTGVSSGYRAQLQGLNRIRDLARIGSIAAITDAFIIIVATLLWGERAIAPALSASALVTAALFWKISRAEENPVGKFAWAAFRPLAQRLIVLGVSLAAALLFANVGAYVIRTLINREVGLADAGLYVAAFTLSGKSVGFLLDSMRADLYPRLSAVADDNARLNILLNGQTEICLLLTIPGVLFLIAFAPYLLRAFYSADFLAAAPLLALFSLGSLARVMSTPLGYVRLAKGKGLLYFLTELGFSALQIALVFVLLKWLGLKGAVIGCVLQAVIQTLSLAYTANRLTGFRWSSECIRLAFILIPTALAVFTLSLFVPRLITSVVGGIIALGVGCFNVRELTARLGPGHRISRLLLRIPLFRRIVVHEAY